MIYDEKRAKFNLAVNVFNRLRELDKPYAELAKELSVYPSRLQKILEQTSSSDWRFVLNLAESLEMSVEQLGANPSEKDIAFYLKKYPGKVLETQNVG